MSIIDVYNTFNVIPNSFIVNGIRFEHTTMQYSDGTWAAYIYEMRGMVREHIYCFAMGNTEEDAIKNLIKENTTK